MFSTTILLAVLFGGFVLSLVLWSVFLRLGLRWAKVPDVTWRRVIMATAIITAVQAAIAVLFLLFSASSTEAAMVLWALELTLTLAALGVIIGAIFKTSFLRALQAWFPTLLASAATVLLVLLIMRPFLFEAFVMPTNSMAPTLLGRHWQGVCPECGRPNYCSPQEDASYYGFEAAPTRMICENFHVVETADAAGPEGPGDRFMVAKFLAPRRWDVIAFRYPGEPSQLYGMRLVGLPGEEIHIENGAVFANGTRLELPESLRGIQYIGEFPEQHWLKLWGSKERPAKLGADEYFVLGDFSAQSKDSRLWEEGAPGHNPYAVPASHIQGVVTHIYWPAERWRVLR